MNKTMSYVGLLGGALIVIATFLPWATISIFNETSSFNGLQGDGWISLISGIIYIVCILMVEKKPVLKIVGLIFAVIALLIGIYEFMQLKKGVGDSGDNALLTEMVKNMITIGYGLYVLIAGAVIAIVGALMIKKATPANTEASPN